MASYILTGCATPPSQVSPAYVSASIFDDMDCDRLFRERADANVYATRMAGAMTQRNHNDLFNVGLGMTVAWPALFFIEGDGGQVPSYAEALGVVEAADRAAADKQCDWAPSAR